jgi:hypothetical protein
MQISNLRVGPYSYREYCGYTIPPSLQDNFSGVADGQMTILAREEVSGGRRTISVYIPVELRSRTGCSVHLDYRTEAEFSRLGYKKLCSIPDSDFSFQNFTDAALLNYVDRFLWKYTNESGGY